MEKLTDVLTDVFKGKLNEHLRWLVVILPVCSLYYLIKHVPFGLELLLSYCFDTRTLVFNYKGFLISFLLLAAVFYLLARRSNSIFRREREKFFPDHKRFKSSARNPVETKIFEYATDEGWKRWIEIENTAEQIDYIKGVVIFGEGITDTFEVPFEVRRPIREHGGYRIIDQLITEETRQWTTFRTFIERVDVGGKSREHLSLYGTHVRRWTVNFVLTRFNYLPRWVPFFSRFELSWLLEIWRFRIYPWLRYFPTVPRIFECKPPLRREILSLVARDYDPFALANPAIQSGDLFTAAMGISVAVYMNLFVCLSKAAWQLRSRIRTRFQFFARRKARQLIWLIAVCGAVLPVSYVLINVVKFTWQLAFIWGGLLKFGLSLIFK